MSGRQLGLLVLYWFFLLLLLVAYMDWVIKLDRKRRSRKGKKDRK